MWLGCLGVAVIGIIFVTWLACRRELAGKPAELIRPKAPDGGRRILLEHIKPLWSKLSFLSKVTLRNAFRYRQRVLMMLIGIGGCTALLVTGFGIKDSIGDVLDFQYGEVMLYDVVVNYDPARIQSEELQSLLGSRTENYSLSYQEEATVRTDGGSHVSGDFAHHGILEHQRDGSQQDIGVLCRPADGVFAGCAALRTGFEHGGGRHGVGAHAEQLRALRQKRRKRGDDGAADAAALSVQDDNGHMKASVV